VKDTTVYGIQNYLNGHDTLPDEIEVSGTVVVPRAMAQIGNAHPPNYADALKIIELQEPKMQAIPQRRAEAVVEEKTLAQPASSSSRTSSSYATAPETPERNLEQPADVHRTYPSAGQVKDTQRSRMEVKKQVINQKKELFLLQHRR
jgi:hypothetical protein